MKKLVFSVLGLAFIFFMAFSIAPTSIASAPNYVNLNKMQEIKQLNSPMFKGQAIYEGKGSCSVCHQKNGQGLPQTFPPLANADYLLEDINRAIRQTMYGSTESITVNGFTYPGNEMLLKDLSDEEVRDVVYYILNSWGNNGGVVTIEDVQAQRK